MLDQNDAFFSLVERFKKYSSSESGHDSVANRVKQREKFAIFSSKERLNITRKIFILLFLMISTVLHGWKMALFMKKIQRHFTPSLN